MAEAYESQTNEKNAVKLNFETVGMDLVDLTEQGPQPMTKQEIEEMAFLTKALESEKIAKRVLKARIQMIVPFALEGEATMCASLDLGDPRVWAYIPYKKFYPELPIKKYDDTTDEGKADFIKRQRTTMNRLIDSETEYVIERVESYGDHIIAYCSRVAACAILKRRFYEGDAPIIKEGHCYTGRVLYLKIHTAVITLGGVDRTINQDTLTNRYLVDLRSYFKPGKPVRVKMRDIVRDENGKLVSCKFDTLAAEMEETKNKLEMANFNEGSTCIVTISHVKPVNKDDDVKSTSVSKGKMYYNIFGWVDGLDVPVKVVKILNNRFGVPLKIGDKLICAVAKNQKDPYLHCIPIAVYGASGI